MTVFSEVAHPLTVFGGTNDDNNGNNGVAGTGTTTGTMNGTAGSNRQIFQHTTEIGEFIMNCVAIRDDTIRSRGIILIDPTGKKSSRLYHPATGDSSEIGNHFFRRTNCFHPNIILIRNRYIVSMIGQHFQGYDLLHYKRVPLSHWPIPRSGSRCSGSAIVGTSDGSIYIIGGKGKTGDRLRGDVESFNINQYRNTGRSIGGSGWDTLPSLNFPRKDAAVIHFNKKLYVIGGEYFDHETMRYIDCPYTEIYDLERNNGHWMSGPNLNIPRKGHCLVSIGESIIAVVGGNRGDNNGDGDGTPIHEIEVWNTGMNAFVILTNNDHRLSLDRPSHFSAIVMNDIDLYLFGGGTKAVEKIRLEPAALTPDALREQQLDTRVSFHENFSNFLPTRPSFSTTENAMNFFPTFNDDTTTTAAMTPSPRQAMSSSSADNIVWSTYGRGSSWLPEAPEIPTIPPALTARNRLEALQSYKILLDDLQVEYSKAIDTAVGNIHNFYERVRDEEVRKLQEQGQVWLQKTNRLSEQTQEDIERQRMVVTKADASRKQMNNFLITLNDTQSTPDLEQEQDNLDEDNVPSQLRCPITLALMIDPVIAADGNTYERSALDEWMTNEKRKTNGNSNDNDDNDVWGLSAEGRTSRQKVRSPLTGEEFVHEHLIPNLAIRSLCEQYALILKENEDKQQHQKEDQSDDE